MPSGSTAPTDGNFNYEYSYSGNFPGADQNRVEDALERIEDLINTGISTATSDGNVLGFCAGTGTVVDDTRICFRFETFTGDRVNVLGTAQVDELRSASDTNPFLPITALIRLNVNLMETSDDFFDFVLVSFLFRTYARLDMSSQSYPCSCVIFLCL